MEVGRIGLILSGYNFEVNSDKPTRFHLAKEISEAETAAGDAADSDRELFELEEDDKKCFNAPYVKEERFYDYNRNPYSSS